ncbi:MAG: hydrogenase subunit MbhD domain-containing protein [Euryarchaeota archaeon]|nr:hydrogenase subunit MbhD domain-containing protein [Euryarchaeota archaeon]
MIEEVLQIVLLCLIVSTALMAITFKDLLAAVISFAATSLLLALEFYILQAPDVAIAEAGIGAALTTAIFILAIKGTVRREET